MQKTHWQKSVEKHNREELLVVIDTNVLISYLWGSKNAEIIAELIFSGKIQPVISDEVVEELLTVGKRSKFKERFSFDVLHTLCDSYRDISLCVVPKKKIIVIADNKDNIFLECAFEANADYLITGDRHLLKIGNYEGIHIVSPADFLRMNL